jgi:hypothetical protein
MGVTERTHPTSEVDLRRDLTFAQKQMLSTGRHAEVATDVRRRARREVTLGLIALPLAVTPAYGVMLGPVPFGGPEWLRGLAVVVCVAGACSFLILHLRRAGALKRFARELER